MCASPWKHYPSRHFDNAGLAPTRGSIETNNSFGCCSANVTYKFMQALCVRQYKRNCCFCHQTTAWMIQRFTSGWHCFSWKFHMPKMLWFLLDLDLFWCVGEIQCYFVSGDLERCIEIYDCDGAYGIWWLCWILWQKIPWYKPTEMSRAEWICWSVKKPKQCSEWRPCPWSTACIDR